MRKRACTDLRGGRSAMVVPTATLIAYVRINAMHSIVRCKTIW